MCYCLKIFHFRKRAALQKNKLFKTLFLKNLLYGSSMVPDIHFVHFIYVYICIANYIVTLSSLLYARKILCKPFIDMHTLYLVSSSVNLLAVKIVVVLDILTQSVGTHNQRQF